MRFHALIWMLAMLPSFASAVTPQRNPHTASNVFLITIDTLRVDHVHCFNPAAVPTPAIDRLCQDGVRFPQAVTASPLTNSSHASILTGRYPMAHGMTAFGSPIRADIPTLAQQFRARGYQTAAFIGAFVLDSRTSPGLERGFDFYDNFDMKLPESVHWGRVERRAEDVVAHALKWMSSHAAGPRFVWIHLYDPHDPYEPPAPFSQRYRDRLYDGEIAYADAALGKFLDALRADGSYNSSVIALVADHGEGLGEHQEDTHGIFLYDTTLRVPLVIKLPQLRDGAHSVAAQVQTVDIAPTMLELAHAPALPHTDGLSLVPLINGHTQTTETAFSETDYPLNFGWAPLRAARTQTRKYIEAPRPELYDLTSDQHETRNLYEPWEPEVQRMRAELAQLRERYPGQVPGAAPVAQSTVEELSALGYLPKTRGETTVAEPSLLPDPKDKIGFQNLLHLAMLKREQKDWKGTREVLQHALAIEPRSADALAQLGTAEIHTGDVKAGIAHLRQAVAANPKDASAGRALADALESSADYAGAARALDLALAAAPGTADDRIRVGRLFVRAADWPKAADQFEAAVFLSPNNVDARLRLADALLHQGDRAGAKAQLQKASQLDPQNPEVKRLLVQISGP